jgi:hypothetical protein
MIGNNIELRFRPFVVILRHPYFGEETKVTNGNQRYRNRPNERYQRGPNLEIGSALCSFGNPAKGAVGFAL